MQLFDKKIFWFLTLILSGCQLVGNTQYTPSTEYVSDNIAGELVQKPVRLVEPLPKTKPVLIDVANELAKKAVRLATQASEALDVATDVSATIDAAEITVKANYELKQAVLLAKMGEPNQFLEQARQNVGKTIKKTQVRLLHFINKKDADCESVLNVLYQLKPKVPLDLCHWHDKVDLDDWDNLAIGKPNIDKSAKEDGKVDLDDLDKSD